MIDLSTAQHHITIEEIVDVLCNKTQNTDRGFFRAVVAYFLAKMASCQRATLMTKDRGEIPVNMYALALATSGYGKGHSVGILENELMKGFKDRFTQDTMPLIAEQTHWDIANKRALRAGTDPNEEYEKVSGDAIRSGKPLFTFDSGTVPAVKQMRHALLLAGCGSINLQIDEIGSNLIGNVDLLNVFLELYDQGIVKGKLVKNTAENTRSEEVDGKTPTNLLLFGAPAKLLDGGQTEDQFYSFLETGYARRCLFGIGQQDRKAFHSQSAEEIYKRLIQPTNSAAVKKWAQHFHSLADPNMFGWRMDVSDEVSIKLLEYKINCEKAADLMPEHDEIKKAELSHRYFKSLKLAGALAFVEQSPEVTMDHLLSAIKLVEESGTAFQSILNRKKAYMKLAEFIASIDGEVTHADLNEQLPFYKTGVGFRNEIMSMATAWGYKQHIIIKKRFEAGIEFFSGETLEETDLNEMVVSYSDNFAFDYSAERVPFEELHTLMNAPGYHWCNHHFMGNHRLEDKAVPGFNMLVIDVDSGVSLQAAQELMKEYRFMTYTTKRHQTEGHGDRFRMLIPINYHLKLDSDDYKEFMNNIMASLPFKSDEAANQRSKKWESFEHGEVFYNNDGVIFDALKFIPKTSKNEEHRAEFKKVENLDNLQRWFAQKINSEGNRNNNLLRYAMSLVDSGWQLLDVQNALLSFNQMLESPLDDTEIRSTILVSVGKRYQKS
ncbi:DNA primase [Stenotrophomonas phage Pokken]|uniref:Putative DNA primase n=1 Tax=Stenotrophomonas phage Pokken TaxID=2596674 RepID=A0A5B9N905_9CAUD|nr:DNA primase [Stenotrophomonas phage Pokken]QEG09285.1 putative DNA primase [Stenotrophomonas phage Pokken]